MPLPGAPLAYAWRPVPPVPAMSSAGAGPAFGGSIASWWNVGERGGGARPESVQGSGHQTPPGRLPQAVSGSPPQAPQWGLSHPVAPSNSVRPSALPGVGVAE